MGNLSKVIACLKVLGIRPKVDNFESKLVIQKTIYILEEMGVRLGYPFGLHVRGAYSRDLTEDIYQHRKDFEELAGEEKLSEKEIMLVNEFKEEMGKPDPAILEIAATYAYFFKQQGMSARDATIKVKEMKPFFSEMQFVQGINRAKALVFKPTEKELKKMKDEFKAWEEA